MEGKLQAGSKCRVPKAEMSLAHLRIRKKISLTGHDLNGRLERGGQRVGESQIIWSFTDQRRSMDFFFKILGSATGESCKGLA